MNKTFLLTVGLLLVAGYVVVEASHFILTPMPIKTVEPFAIRTWTPTPIPLTPTPTANGWRPSATPVPTALQPVPAPTVTPAPTATPAPVIVYVTVTPSPIGAMTPTPSPVPTASPTPTPQARVVTFSAGTGTVNIEIENQVDSNGFNNNSVSVVSATFDVLDEAGNPATLAPGDTFQVRGIQAHAKAGGGTIADYPVSFTTTSYKLNLSQPEAIVSGYFRPIVSYMPSNGGVAPALSFRITGIEVTDDSNVAGLPVQPRQ